MTTEMIRIKKVAVQVEHGTEDGYGACRQRAEGSCDSCRRAHAEYMREWRRNNPDQRARELARQQARTWAQAELARRHDDEFRRLYEEELARRSS